MGDTSLIFLIILSPFTLTGIYKSIEICHNYIHNYNPTPILNYRENKSFNYTKYEENSSENDIA